MTQYIIYLLIEQIKYIDTINDFSNLFQIFEINCKKLININVIIKANYDNKITINDFYYIIKELFTRKKQIILNSIFMPYVNDLNPPYDIYVNSRKLSLIFNLFFNDYNVYKSYMEYGIEYIKPIEYK